MSKIAQMREARNAKAKEAQELSNKYPANQPMAAADAARLDELLAGIEAIDADIGREHKLAQLNVDDPQAVHQAALNAATRQPGQHSEGSNALRAWMQGGVGNLSTEQQQRLRARQTPEIVAGLGLPQIQNAMSTGIGAEGGFTVAPEFAQGLEAAMRAYGAMLTAGTTLRTATGALMNFPTADPTTEEGEIVGENASATVQDTAFGNATLAVYKYSSKSVPIPWELLQDSFVDIEVYVQGLLGMRLGRIAGKHFTTGTGTGQPRGIMTAAASGRVGATGQTLTVTYDDLVDLEHSVDPIYRGQAGVAFMMHDTSLQRVRKIKDSQNRPIFVPGYETGNPGGAPDRLLGRPIVINQDMAVMAANARSIAFGAMRKYVARQVMDLTLFRMTDSVYTTKGQVGFIAFNRMGGNLIDAGGAVKFYQNSAT